jgi:hypothetical protein
MRLVHLSLQVFGFFQQKVLNGKFLLLFFLTQALYASFLWSPTGAPAALS